MVSFYKSNKYKIRRDYQTEIFEIKYTQYAYIFTCMCVYFLSLFNTIKLNNIQRKNMCTH